VIPTVSQVLDSTVSDIFSKLGKAQKTKVRLRYAAHTMRHPSSHGTTSNRRRTRRIGTSHSRDTESKESAPLNVKNIVKKRRASSPKRTGSERQIKTLRDGTAGKRETRTRRNGKSERNQRIVPWYAQDAVLNVFMVLFFIVFYILVLEFRSFFEALHTLESVYELLRAIFG